MGVAPVYRSQVRPGVSAPLQGVSEEAMGAGVSRALGSLGGEVQRGGEVLRAVDRNEKWADANLRFLGVEEQARANALHRRTGEGQNAQAGWAGHADMVDGETRALTDQFLETITDPDLRRDMAARAAQMQSSIHLQELGFEAGKRLEKMGDDTQAIAQQSARRVLMSADVAADLPAAIGDLDAYFDGLDVAPDIRTALKRDHVPAVLDAGVQNRINAGDLDGAEAMVRSEEFAELGPKRSQALLDEIHVERRRIDAAARAETAVAKQAQREALATRKAELDTGAGQPRDWAELAAGYEAIGDTSAAIEARAKGTEMAAVTGSRDLTLPEMQSEIAKLDAKSNTRGLSPAEAAQRSGLRTQLDQSRTRLNRSGGALEQYVYATGKALPPLDMDDPASIARRGALAEAAAAKYGMPVAQPLLESELAGLQQLVQGGPADRMRALEAIGAFGKPGLIAGAARQVAGEDGAFKIAALRFAIPGGRQLARDILRGPDALKANPALFDLKQAQAAFAAYAPSLQGLGPDFASDTFQAARNVYAARMAAAGLTGWSAPEWRNSVDAALGGYHEGGAYKGGSWTFRNQRVLIPTGWTADGVFRRIARMTGEDLGKARVSGPGRWPDGSPIYTGQLREMVPVYLGGTQYGFRSERSTRLLGAQDGGPFVIDLAKVPWR